MNDAGAAQAGGELRRRVLSGLALAALALASAWIGGLAFASLWAAAGCVVVFEWLRLTGVRPILGASVVGCAALCAGVAAIGLGRGELAAPLAATGALAAWIVAANSARPLAAAGVAYAAMTALPVVAVRFLDGGGVAGVIWLFAVVWGTDIAAYFAGRAFGGPKLWPVISPKKTWSGFLGGAMAGAIGGWAVGAASAAALGPWALSGWGLFVASLLCSLMSQGGDLFESAVKRRFHVKDSGALIPGHGGAMDRLDGFGPASLLGLALILAAGR